MDVKSVVDEVIENIKKDRKDTSAMLDDVSLYIAANPERHKEYGMISAKYLELRQRANEQLIKVVEQLRKSTDSGDFGDLSSEDRDSMYDAIEEEDQEERKRKV